MAWLLLDTFGTDLLPGAVHNTTCDTGQTRTAADTVTGLWTYNRRLYTYGGTTEGDVAVWYPQLTGKPAFGCPVFAKIRVDTAITSTGPMIGWASSQSGNNITRGVYFRTTGYFHSIGSGVTAQLSSTQFSIGVDYYFCLVTRATGHWIFIKGGEWTNWTLVYTCRVINTTPLYPAIVQGAGNFYKRVDFFGVADASITPSILISDSFNRGDGSLGNTDGNGDPELSGGGSLTWNTFGTVVIATNQAKVTGLDAYTCGGAWVDTGKTNYSLYATYHATGGGVLVKYKDSANYAIVYATSGNNTLRVGYIIAGAWSSVSLGSITFGAGKSIYVRVKDNGVAAPVVVGFHDNIYIGTATLNSAFAGGITKAGIGFVSLNAIVDNFVCYNNGDYDSTLDPWVEDALQERTTVVLTNPQVGSSNTYKGQLHFHSTGSDGVNSPSAIITAYAGAGYDFVCLTDHDVVTPNPGGTGIGLFLPGDEETTTDTPATHIGHLNADANILGNTRQNTINSINAETNALATICHPEPTPVTWQQIVGLTGVNSIEIWNAIVQYLSSQGDSSARIDPALFRGRQFYLSAVDDCHDISIAAEFNAAWVMVHAPSLTAANIVAALRTGNFYGSQGPNITQSVSGAVLSVSCPDTYNVSFIGYPAGVTTPLQTNNNVTGGDTTTYTCTGSEILVRPVVTRVSDSKKAWGQPVWAKLIRLEASALTGGIEFSGLKSTATNHIDTGGVRLAGSANVISHFIHTVIGGIYYTGNIVRAALPVLRGGLGFVKRLLWLSSRGVGQVVKQVFTRATSGQRFTSSVYKATGTTALGGWRGAGSSLWELMIGGFHQYTKSVGGTLFNAAMYGTGILYGTGMEYAGSVGQVTKLAFTKFTSLLRTSGFLDVVKIVSSFITYYQDVAGVLRSSGRNIFDTVSNQFGGLRQSGFDVVHTGLNLLAGLKPAGKINTDTVLSVLSGGLKPVGNAFKSFATSLYSYLYTSGLVSYVKYHFNLNFNKDLFRTLRMSGNVFKNVPSVLSRVLSMSGTVSGQARKLLAGGIKPASDLFRLISTSLYGGQKFISDLVRQAGALQTKLLVGGLRVVGSVSSQTSKLFEAGIRVTGSIVNQAGMVLSGGLKAVGLLGEIADKLLTGGFKTSGVLISVANKLVGGVLQTSSSMIRFIRTKLTTVLELFGYVMKAAPGNLRQDHSLYNLLPLSQRPLIWDNWVSLQPLHIKQVIQ